MTASTASTSRIAIIHNPKAGRLLRTPGLVEKAAEWLRPLGEVVVLSTTGPHTAGALASQAIADGAAVVVAFGGDGTINEVANGMVGSSVPLAPLPGGTANVLCVETGLGTDPEKAARRLVAESEPVRVALGEMTIDGLSRHFLLMAGVGADAIVVDQVHPGLKARLGKIAYWLSGFSMFGRTLPQFHAIINGAATQRSFVLASRVRNYGGDLEIARQVTLMENCFEAVAFAGENSLIYMPYLAGLGLRMLHRIPGVKVEPATSFTCTPINGDRVPVQLDGELAGYLPAEFRIVPNALTLLIPKAYVTRARKKPWITSLIP